MTSSSICHSLSPAGSSFQTEVNWHTTLYQLQVYSAVTQCFYTGSDVIAINLVTICHHTKLNITDGIPHTVHHILVTYLLYI